MPAKHRTGLVHLIVLHHGAVCRAGPPHNRGPCVCEKTSGRCRYEPEEHPTGGMHVMMPHIAVAPEKVGTAPNAAVMSMPLGPAQLGTAVTTSQPRARPSHPMGLRSRSLASMRCVKGTPLTPLTPRCRQVQVCCDRQTPNPGRCTRQPWANDLPEPLPSLRASPFKTLAGRCRPGGRTLQANPSRLPRNGTSAPPWESPLRALAIGKWVAAPGPAGPYWTSGGREGWRRCPLSAHKECARPDATPCPSGLSIDHWHLIYGRTSGFLTCPTVDDGLGAKDGFACPCLATRIGGRFLVEKTDIMSSLSPLPPALPLRRDIAWAWGSNASPT
jgi:hypothetical protein